MIDTENSTIVDILTREGVDIAWREDPDHETLHWGHTCNMHIKVTLKKGEIVSEPLYMCPGSQAVKNELSRSRVLSELFSFASDLAGMSSLDTWIEERGEKLIGVTMDGLSKEKKQERYREYYSVCERIDRELHNVFGEYVFEELYEILIG